MRILTRYILREVTSHALLGGALFTFIIFTRDLGKILEFVVRDSASYSDVARIIAYTLPNNKIAGALMMDNYTGDEAHTKTLHLKGWESRIYKQ